MNPHRSHFSLDFSCSMTVAWDRVILRLFFGPFEWSLKRRLRRPRFDVIRWLHLVYDLISCLHPTCYVTLILPTICLRDGDMSGNGSSIMLPSFIIKSLGRIGKAIHSPRIQWFALICHLFKKFLLPLLIKYVSVSIWVCYLNTPWLIVLDFQECFYKASNCTMNALQV